MIDAKEMAAVAEACLEGTDLFLVGVTVSRGNEVEVTIDSDTEVTIDNCVDLSRAIEKAFDRDAEDFELTVASAGIGQPLVLLRQFKKLIGRPVEVVLKAGGKIVGELVEAHSDQITLTYPEKVAVEGTKKKKLVDQTRTFKMDEIKLTCEHLDFK
ncbi:MAG: ribosome assembly cofactor RimP [Rikenellaceae bacterium]|jgi:ribosome maturation factor RimP|nr:ribosome assembly cofactor RimP [Rikenellaceae bacterium]